MLNLFNRDILNAVVKELQKNKPMRTEDGDKSGWASEINQLGAAVFASSNIVLTDANNYETILKALPEHFKKSEHGKGAAFETGLVKRASMLATHALVHLPKSFDERVIASKAATTLGQLAHQQKKHYGELYKAPGSLASSFAISGPLDPEVTKSFITELRADPFYTTTIEPLVVSKFEAMGKKEEAYINVSLAGEHLLVAIIAQHQNRMGNNSVEDGLGDAAEVAAEPAASSAAPAAAATLAPAASTAVLAAATPAPMMVLTSAPLCGGSVQIDGGSGA